MKRVAVQEELNEMKAELKNRGYEVVDFNDSGHIDAIVYADINNDISSVNNSIDGNMYGAILINARNKTIDEIENIIETRRYERLFT